MTRCFASLALSAGLTLLVPNPSTADDEQQSLALLVKTLEQVDDPTTQAALLQGMFGGLAGRRNVPAPDGWSRLAVRLARSKDANVRELTSQLSQIFGDEEAVRRALAAISDRSAPTAARKRSLHALLTQRNDRVSALLEPLLDEPELRLDAIRGYATIENPKAPDILLKRYPMWPARDRKAVIETLATRKPYAEALLRAIAGKKIPQSDVPAHVARSLSLILGEAFAGVFGDVRQLSQDRSKLIGKYKRMITGAALAEADARKGRAVYNKTCASCHVMYGSGGNIGPDLTGSNRANLDYILLNSVDPSYDVPEGYRMVIIQTVDGRVVSGVIAEENEQRIVLKTVEQPRVIILKSDIEDRRVSPKSMMPEGQLEQMKPQDVINLIKYLQTIEQVEIAP